MVLRWRNHHKTNETALILLHPFPYDGRAWDPILPFLGNYSVVCPDMPGCGFSVTWDDARFEPVADDLVYALRDAGIKKVVVAGESMGGYLALTILERHPEFVAGIALIDTKMNAEVESAKMARFDLAKRALEMGAKVVADSWQGVLGNYTKTHCPQVVQIAKTHLMGARAEGIAWCSYAIANRADREVVLANYSGPVLIVRGEEDTLCDVEQFMRMQAVSKQVKAVQIERCGHIPQFEAPAQLAGLLNEIYESTFKV